MQRLRPLSEQECYYRCYGRRRYEETVRIVQAEARDDRRRPSAGAERIRLLFAAALDAPEPEAA
jgi:hypothetical protein